MGSPISPIIADIFMDRWEKDTLNQFHSKPKVWWRYVDDTFTVIKEAHIEEFHSHINKQIADISFTKEMENNEGELAMLDCKVIRKEDGRVITSIYRKPTHSDRYLDYNSAHTTSVKAGLVKCLADRVRKLTDERKERNKELKLVFRSLQNNSYPANFIAKHMRCKKQVKEENKEYKSMAILPYKPGVSEKLKRILNKVGVKVIFRPINKLRDQLGQIKDPVNRYDQSHLVYKIPCAECPISYIGETSRCLRVRIEEHKRLARGKLAQSGTYTQLEKQSAIAAHCLDENHTIDWDRTKILSKINKWRERRIAETLFIITTKSTCNKGDSITIPEAWRILLNENRNGPKTG